MPYPLGHGASWNKLKRRQQHARRAGKTSDGEEKSKKGRMKKSPKNIWLS
jgi:hypothetical protein